MRLRELEYLAWLPLDIDPENCNFSDVERVLKVLDDYAIKKLSKIEEEPNLPAIIKIQRACKSYLISTRLRRAVRDVIKVNKFRAALQKFEERAPPQTFFYKYERQFRQEI